MSQIKNNKSVWTILGWTWLAVAIVVVGAAVIGNLFSQYFTFALGLWTPVIFGVLLGLSVLLVIFDWIHRKWRKN